MSSVVIYEPHDCVYKTSKPFVIDKLLSNLINIFKYFCSHLSSCIKYLKVSEVEQRENILDRFETYVDIPWYKPLKFNILFLYGFALTYANMKETVDFNYTY